MTVTVIESDEPESEPAVEALTETVEALVELVEELATEPEPEPEPIIIVEQDVSTPMIVGSLAARVDAIEDLVIESFGERVETQTVVIDPPYGGDLVEEPEPEPDVPPQTWKTKLSRIWFGENPA